MAEEKIIPGVATEKESDEVLEEIRTQTKEVLNELLAVAKMKPGQILVVGCSSSEIGSYKIGSHSSETIGQTVYKALYEELKPLDSYWNCYISHVHTDQRISNINACMSLNVFHCHRMFQSMVRCRRERTTGF